MTDFRDYIENKFPSWNSVWDREDRNPIEEFIANWEEYDSFSEDLRSLVLWVLDQVEEE